METLGGRVTSASIGRYRRGYEWLKSIYWQVQYVGEIARIHGLEEKEHESFIQGRTGKVLINGKEIGIMGEMHPKISEIWKLENPVASLEINLDATLQTNRLTQTTL